ncbi:U-box domain-containing protein 21-like [Phalaenopsis equestris]|uniref:U-box domain-containing protein 21-like n=1 Tax=Phalaenopsis equestris TaxID=78828 RepID=UPI0009E34B56|nr:U-box domain-containing protein 21-like [Phalaenopsis equestris]
MAFSRKKRPSWSKLFKSATTPPIVSELTFPGHFRCPISLDLMKDPVTAPTGITYDRENIERWLETGNSTCPVTNMALNSHGLIPNHTIRRLIQDWCASNRSHGVDRIPTPRIPITQLEAFDLLSDFSSATKLQDKEHHLELITKVRSLIKESERNRRCFLSVGAPAVLASAFRFGNSKSPVVLRETLTALAGLLPFEDDNIMKELSSSESLNSIIQIMKNGDISCRLSSVTMLKKMASTSKDLAKSLAKQNGLIEGLTEFIRVPISTHLTKVSLAVTFYLISNDETMSKKCVNLGIVHSLLEILVDSDKNMTEKVLIILDALCRFEFGREKACEHALTVPVLAKKMFRVSETATEFVVSVLWKVCRNCRRSNCLVECLQVGLLQKMLLLLQVGCSETTKEKATEMIKLMSSVSEKFECVDTMDFKGLNRRIS